MARVATWRGRAGRIRPDADVAPPCLPAPPPPVDRVSVWERLHQGVQGREDRVEARTAGALLLLFAALTVAGTWWPQNVPPAVLLPLIVMSGVVHRPRTHAVVVLVVLAGIVTLGAAGGGIRAGLWNVDPAMASRRAHAAWTALAALLIASVTMWRTRARALVGVRLNRGESILSELSQRVVAHGVMPELPSPWHVEAQVLPAQGQGFSGDFVVSRLFPDPPRFEAVLVDVSGKGLDAASRSLELAGAFDALLGSLPPERFLPAANDFLVRQEWPEGFATAAQIVVDLRTGDVTLRRAGHPPPVAFRAGSGAWTVLEVASGPALGIVPGAAYPAQRGRLGPGDAVVLYSDGLVENRTTLLDAGIDRLLGRGQRLVSSGFDGGARALCAAAPDAKDDRAALVLWVD